MPDEIADWFATRIAPTLVRLRAGNDLAQKQLRKSYRQIAVSQALLDLPVPKVWHPEAPAQNALPGRGDDIVSDVADAVHQQG